MIHNASRRGFLSGMGGLVLAFHLPGCKTLAPADTTIGLGNAIAEGAETDINAWIRLAPNGVVTFQVGAAEMGQGIYTSLPMILAEFLDCDWANVRAESSSTHETFNRGGSLGSSQITGGSESITGYFPILREAGATARGMLIAAAAKTWGVDAAGLTTEPGFVVNGDEKLSYGELAELAATLKPATTEPRPESEWRILGTDKPRMDVPAKCDGSATFGIDAEVEGMVYAAIAHCPHYGGKLVSFDDEPAFSDTGVIDVFAYEEGAVICVAESYWQAKQALDRVNITWDMGEGAGLDDARVGQVLQEAMDNDAYKVESHGELGEPTIVATYEVPYLEHAPLEPPNALAWVQADRVDLWAPTQAQTMVQRQASKIAGVKAEQVFVHTTLLGGGFGRKGFWDFTNEAVFASKHTGLPVKLVYTREAAFTKGYYRPRLLARHSARLDDQGMPLDWRIEVAGQSILEMFIPGGPLFKLDLAEHIVLGGLVHTPYAIPNMRTDYARISLPIPVGWWRSVEGSTNGFIRESFVDEMAHAGGQDPIELRRKLMADNPRFLNVFNAAVEAAGELAPGLSRGTAIFKSFGSIVAEVADVEVIDGEVYCRNVGAAVDCGTAIHPNGVKYQIQGALTMGLSAMLHEGLSFKDGAVVQSNFHEYPLMRLKQAPKVNVAIVNSGEDLGGIGEPGLPPIAGAVGNAIFAATGKRIRSLPVGDQLKG